MRETKSETIRFMATPEFKNQIENVAANLRMPMSQLIRDSVMKYIEIRSNKATGAFMARALKLFMSQRGDTLQEALEKIEQIDTFDLLDNEMYADRKFMTDELFAKLIDSKLLAAAKKEAVEVEA